MKKRRRGLGCFTVLVILAVLVVGADFAGRWYLQEQMSTQIASQAGTSQKPTVRVGGWSLIAQLIQRKFDDVEIDVRDAKVGNAVASHSVLRLEGVPLTQGQLTADRVTGNITVGYDQFGDQKGTKISFMAPNRIQVQATTQMFGQQIPVTISAEPQIDGAKQTLTLGDPQLSFGQVQLPPAVTQNLMKDQMKPKPLPVPKGLRATSIAATAAGVVIYFAGTNVPLQEMH